MDSTANKIQKRSREDNNVDSLLPDPTNKLEEFLNVLYCLKERGYLNEDKQLPAANIIGEQSTGKSSFFNNLVSEIVGLEGSIAPEDAKKCTKFPLSATGANLGHTAPKYTLHMHTGAKFEYNTEAEVHTKIKEFSSNYDQASCDVSSSLNLYINAKAPLRIIDFPGGTSNYNNETFLKAVTQIDRGGFPILLYMQRADLCYFDPDQGYLLGALKELKSKPEWQNLKLFVVMTYADAFLSNANSINEYTKGANNILNNIPGAKLALVQLRDSNNKTASFAQIREAEASSIKQLAKLRDIRSADGSPAVYLGLRELLQAFMEQMCHTVIEDPQYLPLLSKAMNDRLNDLQCQKELFEKQKNTEIIPVEICSRISNVFAETENKLRLDLIIKQILREIADKFYQQTDLKEQAAKIDPQGSSMEVKPTRSYVEVQYDNIWRDALKNALAYIGNNSQVLADEMLRFHAESVDKLFKPYQFLPKTSETLRTIFKEFRSEQREETFKDVVKNTIIKQMNLVEKVSSNPEAVKQNFQPNSIFLRDAIRENKSKPLQARKPILEVICTLDMLLRYIQNNLIVEYMIMLNNAFKEYIFKNGQLNGCTCEITPEQLKEIKEEEKKLLTLMPLLNSYLDKIKHNQEMEIENNKQEIDQELEETEEPEFNLTTFFRYFAKRVKQ